MKENIPDGSAIVVLTSDEYWNLMGCGNCNMVEAPNSVTPTRKWNLKADFERKWAGINENTGANCTIPLGDQVPINLHNFTELEEFCTTVVKMSITTFLRNHSTRSVSRGETIMPAFAQFLARPTPRGMIQVFTGLLTDIPDGWILADGLLGSPDLTDRFVRGTATPATEPGTDVGGENTVPLTGTENASHNHTLVPYSHTHRVTGNAIAGSSGGIKRRNSAQTDDIDTNFRVPPTQSTLSSGSSSAHENKPPFFEVAYIYKT